MSGSDLTFFTNEPGHTLLDRFKTTLKDTRLFDVIVGYFRASGFYQLHESIEPIDKTRILIGLGIDERCEEGKEEVAVVVGLGHFPRDEFREAPRPGHVEL